MSKLNIEKMISKEIMTAIIEVLSIRQDVFEELIESRKNAVIQGNELLAKCSINGSDPDYVELVTRGIKTIDENFLKLNEKELSNQEHIIEFLHIFTNKKFNNARNAFSEGVVFVL